MNLETPRIIKEGAHGVTAISIEDEMLTKREVFCVGEINADTANSLILQMLHLQRQDAKAPITLYLNSPGGETDSGLAIYDVMQSLSCPVHTVCTGIAASMASVLFIAGKKRKMLAHSRLMIHDPLTRNAGGAALDVNDIAANMMAMRTTIAGIIASHSGHTTEQILEKTRRDCYFSADEAIAFNLADGIVKKL